MLIIPSRMHTAGETSRFIVKLPPLRREGTIIRNLRNLIAQLAIRTGESAGSLENT